jgi:SAM-dependent MidA family methyltransferase
MDLVLYAPELGYYTAGAQKLGAAGDFITAPEISPLFGKCIARQLSTIMSYSALNIIELGAGNGKLAVDIILALEQLNCLPDSYAILEVSADLRERQQTYIYATIPHHYNRFSWLDSLPELFHGAIFANEVLDALPVHLVHWQSHHVNERGVTLNGHQFAWKDGDISNAVLQQTIQNIAVPDNYVSEICLSARGLISSLANCLHHGGMLFIDYGFGAREYYHPQRNSGTLMCHYRHIAHDDPFLFPGLQDITAHVNFTDIAECAIDAGTTLLGYTTQAHFLINCGITDLLNEYSTSTPHHYLPLAAQLQKLTSPAEMGDLFKVIAFGKGLPEIASACAIPSLLPGFYRANLSRML